MKIIKTFQPKIVIFTAVKKCSILHGRVFVMQSMKNTSRSERIEFRSDVAVERFKTDV